MTTDAAIVRCFAEQALAAVLKHDLDEMVGALTDGWNARCGFGSMIVLIDERSGAPTFAGGRHLGREHFASMEECRRRGAPMVIWQAFNENRIVVAHHWVRRVMRDARLAPLRHYYTDGSRAGDSFVAIPLALPGRKVGVVSGLVSRELAENPATLGLWSDLAHETAIALLYAEALRAARASGSDRERRRLNEDLHDSVGQDVFALRMLAARAEVASREWGSEPAVEHARELRALADRVSDGLRSLIGERRRVRETLRLSQQLSGLTQEVAARSGIAVRCEFDQTWDHLDAECRDTVVRVVREALRNVEKHSHARTASVRVGVETPDDGMVLIEVRDDGGRLDPHAVDSTAFGLRSIRDRAAAHGGSVQVAGTPGTTIRVRLRPTFESAWAEVAHG